MADEYDAFGNEFLSPDDPRPWDNLRTSANSLLKGFWALVKSKLGPKCIAKCFITGVSPLSMADHTSGFNVASYVYWKEGLSGLCGLTEEDIYAALNLLSVSTSELDIQRHFDIMNANYNGYLFAPSSKVQHVFNTNTCLEYLQVSNQPQKSLFLFAKCLLTYILAIIVTLPLLSLESDKRRAHGSTDCQ